MKRWLRLGILFLLAAAPVRAQDLHYWSQQYGTRAELLGGAVVGSVLDLSSTYYNPGALALMKDPSILLSARAFEDRKLRLEDHEGKDLGFEDSKFGPAPSLFTTLIPISSQRLAFSVFTRETFEVDTSAPIQGTLDTPAGPAAAAGEYFIDYNVSDTWFGVTWARMVSDSVGIGVTPYLAVRSNRNRQEAFIQASNDSGAAAALFVDDYRYTHYRMLLKMGITWQHRPWTLGLSVTTPSLGLGFLSGGDALFHRTILGADLDGVPGADPLLAFYNRPDEDAEFHSPLSIAGGFSYVFGKTVIHATGEWFDGVGPFNVLDVPDLPSEFPGVSLTRRLVYEAHSVRNVGAGLEHRLTPGVEVFTSFITDFSAATSRVNANHNFSAWDLYHVTGGAAFRIHGLDLTGGIGYSFGSSDITEPPVLDDGVGIEDPGLRASYRKIKYIVGFAFTI